MTGGTLTAIVIGGTVVGMAGLAIRLSGMIEIGWQPGARRMACGALTIVMVIRTVVEVAIATVRGHGNLVVEISG